MPLVVHVLPYDGIGGVEIAARTVPDGPHSGLQFAKLYLVVKDAWGRPNPFVYSSENDPRAYVSAVRRLAAARPDVVIASLWRSCLVLLALKLLRPSTRCVTFLHSAVDMHAPDRWLNRLAMWCSQEVWADSQATIDARVPPSMRGRARVISFLAERLMARDSAAAAPRFVFWGRLHWQKDLPRAVRLFARIAQAHPGATFDIIGPDGGAKQDIEAQIERLGVTGVSLLGGMAREEIFAHARSCSFYLQTSAEEGAAMSVMEAMQLGLVPVVTPAGEIGNYCRDGDNAVLVTDDEEAAGAVVQLLADDARYRAIAARAAATWSDKPLYRDDVLDACSQLLQETVRSSARA